MTKTINMPNLIQVDSRDMKWPEPMRALSQAYKKARDGNIIELLSTECCAETMAKEWCRKTGNRMARVEHDARGVLVIAIKITNKKKSKPLLT